jgi:hypothetical protein
VATLLKAREDAVEELRRAGSSTELPLGTFKEEAKVGPYVTFNEHGDISDLGVRTETSHTVGTETGILDFGVEAPGLSGDTGAASSFPGLFPT